MRTRIFQAIIFTLFFSVLAGLFYTQIIRYGAYASLSEKNRIRILPLEAPRGKIYDTRENLLVSNRLAFDVEIIYKELKHKEKVKIIALLSAVLGIERNELSRRMEKASKMPFVPVKIAYDVEKEKAISLEEMMLDLSGIIVTVRPMRSYIYKNNLSSVLGYLGKISEDELIKYKGYGYYIQDLVGKGGIEKSYNDYLRGSNGGVQAEVDNRGRQVRVLAVKKPEPGKNIYLTIDMRLQEMCDYLLGDNRGAIVVMDPTTGGILALTSHPNFDPNVFVRADNFRKITSLLRDTRAYPMLNRAITGEYPPGSVFKIVVATASLDTQRFVSKRTFSCGGSYAVGNRLFRCWEEEGHGGLNIIEALKHSCNVFFYQLGLFVGPVDISKYAYKFGLGKVAGIDLPGEAAGFIPTPAWKEKAHMEPWFKGETANFAIGQGYVMVTPLQIARVVSAVCNGGKLVQPFLVRKIENIELHHATAQDTGISEEALDIVRTGLRDVVNAQGGTGFYAKSKEVIIAGKTGTAQNPRGKPHAWFAGFAPFKNPKIAIVVFLEHGGKGGLRPAGFAKELIEEAKRLELL